MQQMKPAHVLQRSNRSFKPFGVSHCPAINHCRSSPSHVSAQQQSNSVARSYVMTRAAKSLFNQPENAVYDMLNGLVAVTPHLNRLDGYPDIKVVYDITHDKKTVAIISGGGSGHEPAHAGYVGHGMLTGAVAGDVFASPSAEAVLAAIRQVTGPPGCLLIIKNYTGDRLHFGLAAERAKADGLQVEMVFVGEDVAIATPGLAGRRGLAGTVLVHKAAGAAAAEGRSLSEVAAVAQKVADNMATLGVALSVCTLPGKQPSDRITPGEIEIGLGIHGEPGTRKAPAMAVGPLVTALLSHITSSPFFSLAEEKGQPRLVLLVNNLGTTTPMEMSIVADAALQQLRKEHNAIVERVFVGSFVTSLDMAGVSLTLLKADDALLKLLDASVGAPSWPATCAAVGAPKAPTPVPGREAAEAAAAATSKSAAAHDSSPEAVVIGKAIRAACEALVAEADGLNELDKKVGDGDCGDTVAMGARAILADLDAHKIPLHEAAATLVGLSSSVGHAVGGTSGGLYEVALTAGAVGLQGPANVAAWAGALRRGVQSIQKYGGAKAGSRTMLDALLPACEALEQSAAAGDAGPIAAAKAAAAADGGVEATKSMAAAAGRASYVPKEVLASIPDPGAKAAAVWLNAVAKALA